MPKLTDFPPWIQNAARDIDELQPGPHRVVDREAVAEIIQRHATAESDRLQCEDLEYERTLAKETKGCLRR